MAAPVSGSAPGSVAVAPPRGSPGLAEPGHDSGAAREAAFEVAAAPPWAENPSLRPRTGSPELNADLVPGGGGSKASGLAAAMRRTALRVLAVTALALAGLLVFGLLPGDQDAGAVIPGQRLLPPAPAVHSLHPHGPNRPLRPG